MSAVGLRLIGWPELSAKIPFTRQHIARLERAGQFPQRLRCGLNRVAWIESEVEDWIMSRQRGARPAQRRQQHDNKLAA